MGGGVLGEVEGEVRRSGPPWPGRRAAWVAFARLLILRVGVAWLSCMGTNTHPLKLHTLFHKISL